jgi:alkylation response protein AidB-like acyl-CoA dehydrogenase
MEYALDEEADALRLKLRAMVAESLPADWLSPFTDDPHDFELSQAFNARLAAEGLLTLSWPTEFGGLDAGVDSQIVVREEMWAAYEPRGSQYMALNWVGPAIMAFGTPRQKSRWLPQIAEGQLTWCQGFSEPEAGSDLASLRTTAKVVDGGWIVNGQKIWTSYAETAQACVLAARTGAPADRHRGISMFLLPMDRPGIEVRPIKSMLGRNHLNEVFLTDVPLTEEDLLGEVNGGWHVIRHILAHERVGIARYARSDRLLNQQRESLGDEWAQLPAAVRVRFIRALVHTRVARLLAGRVHHDQALGVVSDADAAIARLTVTHLDQEAAEILMESAGPGSVDAKGIASAQLHGAIEDFWRYSRASTVASGASEILKTVLARQIVGGNRG